MSSDNQSDFLPKSLKDYITILVMVGVPVGGIWVWLAKVWQSTTGEAQVSIRLLLVTAALSVTVLALMAWSWWRRPQKPRELRLDELPLEIEEKELIEAVAHSPVPVPLYMLRDAGKLHPTRFDYHWHRLYRDYGLVEHADTHLGQHRYRLSQRGREYAIKVLIV